MVPPSRVIAFSALLAGLLVAVLFPILPSRLSVKRGDVAAQTIRAPREVRYNSDELRKQIQDQRLASVREVVSYDVDVRGRQRASLRAITDRITGQRNSPGFPRATRDEGIARIQGVTLSASQRGVILDFTPEQWNQTVEEAERVLSVILEEPFSAGDSEDRKASVRNRVQDGLTTIQGDIVVSLVQPLVVPTQRTDAAATQREKDRVAAAVEPQPRVYAKSQVIVREGDVIDEVALEALRAAGLLESQLSLEDLAAVLVVSLLSAGALGLYIHVFQPPSLGMLRRLVATAILIGGLVLTAKLYLPLVVPDSDRRFLAFVLPVAAVPMLVAALFEAPFALAIAVVCTMLATFTALYLPEVSGIVGLSAAQPLQMAAAYLFGSLAGVMVMHRAERFNRFLLAGVAVSAASFMGLLAFWFLDGSRRPLDLAWMAGASVITGGLSAVLTVGLFALLGSVFGITTRLQLMELAQFNAPLLRRLQDEAPGTFHHSIIVGNLAERAADLIGADSLLVRVGAYYHDIGKMGRPGFFAENQLSGGNPHDALAPLDSSAILQEHVHHGLELARRFGIPERVRACIQEHHGTLRTAYFYRKAVQTDPDVDPMLFTYSGPRPQSRETALVMLADSTEATVRAAKDRSTERIDTMVENVIAERMAEGQFDDCDLTLRDLRVIAESFKQTMRAVYHPRVEYPEPTAAEQERRRTAALPPASRLTLVPVREPVALPEGRLEEPPTDEQAPPANQPSPPPPAEQARANETSTVVAGEDESPPQPVTARRAAP
ncbi:MAG: HDIG domain-containing protein [Chloroflexi bacterium]|nr:HDIG domain-containing protein [Chloroflexota bacterium]